MKQEQTAYARNKLLSTLMNIGHGDLTAYLEQGLLAATQEPELLGRFLTWNNIKGKVRDSKVAFPVIALRGLLKEDMDLAVNAVANLLFLSPRDLLRAYEFNKKLTGQGQKIPHGYRRILEMGMREYLVRREANTKWWDRTVLQHRDSMKRLYRITHMKPSARAQKVLFEQDYPQRSVFLKVARLRELTPKEAAGVILTENIPFEVAIGSVTKAKDQNILLALIEGMTGNQLITNSKMLTRLGVMTNPVLKAAYDAAISRVKHAPRQVDALKAGVAAENVDDPEVAEKLIGMQRVQTAKQGSIEGDWVVLGDVSGSMSESIDLAKKIAAFLTERVAGKVYLIFFNTGPSFYDVTGLSYDQILKRVGRIMAGGGTSIGCGLDYLLKGKIEVQGIAIVSDGGDNTFPHFHEAYKKYSVAMGVDPTVYLYRVAGDSNDLANYCTNNGIQLNQFDLLRGVDYYSLPNLIQTMRTNQYSLVDEIMGYNLLTIEDVFKRKGN